jgi:predicted nucleotidyltransferase component of viral defense system
MESAGQRVRPGEADVIAAAEIHRQARGWGVDPMIVELDYVLGCFLSRWFRHPMAAQMVFKGGTCLRKCYFPDYRFSEDVDITAPEPVDVGQLQEAIEAVTSDVQQTAGVDLRVQPPRIETADAGDGTPYLEARLYVRGPLRRTGWPQAIRIDISTGEPMAFPAVKRELDHPYSDSAAIGAEGLRIPCYDLREMLLEKLRGLSGQRRYAIARDLYDAHWLLDHAQVAIGDVIPYARAKFAARGLEVAPGLAGSMEIRKDEFMNDWGRSVDRLIPGERRVGFDAAWATTVQALTALVVPVQGQSEE